eukprot:m.151317 g.151317  ORF g.151317 m.151317 type:complete len:68 (+) comp52819_c0_seq1:179-382(+)
MELIGRNIMRNAGSEKNRDLKKSFFHSFTCSVSFLYLFSSVTMLAVKPRLSIVLQRQTQLERQQTSE